VKSEAEQLAFRRLTADRLRSRGDYQSAFDEYLSLAESNGGMQMTRDDDRRITLSMDRWLTGRLEQLWREVSGDDRARLDERIAASALAVQSQGVGQAQRFLVLFGFHPQAVNVRRSLAEEFALSGEVALAQNQLLHLCRNSDERTAAMALERLARLFREHGLPRDANYYYERLGQRYPKVPLADGTLVADHLTKLTAAGAFGSAACQPVSWSDAKIEDLRTGTSYSYYGNPEHDLQYTPYRLPFFQDRRFRFYQSHQRLGVTTAVTDEIEWLVPLKRSVSNSQGNLMPAETSGHVLFAVHSGILHALSQVDRKILWTQALDPKGARNVYYNANQTAAQPMQRSDQLSPYSWLQREGQQQNTTLAVVNSDYVCVLGRRMLEVRDTVTGRLRWSKDRLPSQARVYGTDSLVFIVPPDTGKTITLSAIDGSRVDLPGMGSLIQKTMRILPEGLIIAENKASNSILGLTKGATSFRFHSPQDNRDLWTQEYPSGTYLSLMDDNYLVALKPTGDVDLLDLETGDIEPMQGVSEEDLKTKTEVRCVSDHANLYLIINRKRQSNRYFSYYSDGNMPGIPVNGTVFAWNRDTGKFLWKQEVTDQQLMLMHFTHSPLMIFNTQTYKQVENISFAVMNTLAVDKFTGRVQVDASAPSNYSNFRTYDLNLGQRTMEFRSYQLRLRITALPPGTAEEAPAIAE
jgi:outer membrane protein assembly factor BamB